MTDQQKIDHLKSEVRKFRQAIADMLPWIEPTYGPSWATDDAKRRNYAASSTARDNAWALLPTNYGLKTNPDGTQSAVADEEEMDCFRELQ